MPGYERVQAELAAQDVNVRHGRAGSDGHFLDHVQQPQLVELFGFGIEPLATEQQRHHLSARRQLFQFVEAAAENHRQRATGNPQEKCRLPERNEISRPRGCGMDFDKDAAPKGEESPAERVNGNADDIDRRDDAWQRQQKQQDNLPAVDPRHFLPLKEVQAVCRS